MIMKKVKEEKEHVMPPGFSLSQAEDAIKSLLTHVQNSKKDTLFEDAPTRINMDVVALKIPTGLGHFTNINLPYSPYSSEPEILFIIPDDKRNSTEPEQLVNKMKDKLAQFNINNIREVMTVTQVKNDFSTYEAKRALAKRIDVVIGMKSIFNLLPSILGREFYKKKKVQLALELHDGDNWEELFEKVLRKTIFNISLKGPTSTLLVGQTNLSAEELTQNVSKIVNWLMRMFPGGWNNVNQVSLYTAGVPPLLIYLGLGTRNDVTKPVVTKGRKVTEPVEGDLSTLPGRHVKVHPYGNIEVLRDLDQSDEVEEEEVQTEIHEDEVDESNVQEPVEKKNPKKNKDKKSKKSKHSEIDAEEKYVEAVFKRQEFEESQKKMKKRVSQSEDEEGLSIKKSKKQNKGRKSAA